MGENTNIGWTMHTANTWWGCIDVHDGCTNCFARVFAFRVGKGDAWEGIRYAVDSVWGKLGKWQRDAAKAGEVHEVFCGSMMDIFEKSLPVVQWDGTETSWTTGDLRDRLFNDVVPATPNLLYQFLTKRPGNVTKMVPAGWLQPGGWPANVITGTSVVDQETADTLIPQLLKVPGRRFLSIEPLLGPVDLRQFLPIYTHEGPPCCIETEGWHRTQRSCGIHWTIVGGESGAGRRPCDPAWIRSVVDQCRAAGVPVYVKQDSGLHPGLQGRIDDETWGFKEFPAAKEPARA